MNILYILYYNNFSNNFHIIMQAGLDRLCEGKNRTRLTHILLCLNTHADIPPDAVQRLLEAAPRLRVLEFGGAASNTRSLYFQGGDAKRRHQVGTR